jgi:hypothetical protein
MSGGMNRSYGDASRDGNAEGERGFHCFALRPGQTCERNLREAAGLAHPAGSLPRTAETDDAAREALHRLLFER